MVRFKKLYFEQIVPKLIKDLSLKNLFAAPRLEKIVINMGVGDGITNPDIVLNAKKDLALIAGQEPVLRKAKKSVAGFKLREGQLIGCMVTLRGNKMYEFLDRLINMALPRVRDFRGLSVKSFDGHGNYSLGIKEHIIFPELSHKNVDGSRGLDVTIVTNSITNDVAGYNLLKAFDFPFIDEVA